jgi:hypothetical protein
MLLVGHQDNGTALGGGNCVSNSDCASSSLCLNGFCAWTYSSFSNESDRVFFDPNDTQGLSAYQYDNGNGFYKSTNGGYTFSGTAPQVLGYNFQLAFHGTQLNRFMLTKNTGNGCTVLETIDGYSAPYLPPNTNDLAPPIPAGSCPTALAYVADLGCWDEALVEALGEVDLLARALSEVATDVHSFGKVPDRSGGTHDFLLA